MMNSANLFVLPHSPSDLQLKGKFLPLEYPDEISIVPTKGLASFTQLVKVRVCNLVLALPSILFSWKLYPVFLSLHIIEDICIHKVCITNPLLPNALLRRESSPHNVHHRGAITARVRSGEAEQNGEEEKNLEKDMIQFLGVIWLRFSDYHIFVKNSYLHAGQKLTTFGRLLSLCTMYNVDHKKSLSASCSVRIQQSHLCARKN